MLLYVRRQTVRLLDHSKVLFAQLAACNTLENKQSLGRKLKQP